MRFVVLGAGAIGAYVGAALARGGADVVLIARGPHLAALQTNGVRVLSPRGDFAAHPRATDDIAAVADADCLVVGLKAQALTEMMPRVGPLLEPDACVLPAQNGVPWWFFQGFGGELEGSIVEAVDQGGLITQAIAPARVVGCVTYPAAEIVEPGVIRHVEGTRLTIGEPDGSFSERCATIADALIAGGLKCPVEEQIREQLWLKLIGNVAFNPITALTGATLGELGSIPEMPDVLREVMEEVTLVGKRLGIELPVSVERRLEAGLAVGNHKSSMLQDLEAGKRLELDCMTGAVLEIAGKLGVPIPHVATVHACAKLLDQLRAERPG